MEATQERGVTLHSDDLTVRQDEEEDSWLDTGMLFGAAVCATVILGVFELCRLPGRVWRLCRGR